MSEHMQEFDRISRRKARTLWLVVAAVLAGAGAWATLPFGIVLLSRSETAGWALVAAGLVLVAACAAAIVGAVRSRVAPQSLPGKANPAFGEPRPSANPDGGYSTAGMKLGSY
jgi:NO-binding membrane sensor protein with MHYT domain